MFESLFILSNTASRSSALISGSPNRHLDLRVKPLPRRQWKLAHHQKYYPKEVVLLLPQVEERSEAENEDQRLTLDPLLLSIIHMYARLHNEHSTSNLLTVVSRDSFRTHHSKIETCAKRKRLSKYTKNKIIYREQCVLTCFKMAFNPWTGLSCKLLHFLVYYVHDSKQSCNWY